MGLAVAPVPEISDYSVMPTTGIGTRRTAERCLPEYQLRAYRGRISLGLAHTKS